MLFSYFPCFFAESQSDEDEMETADGEDATIRIQTASAAASQIPAAIINTPASSLLSTYKAAAATNLDANKMEDSNNLTSVSEASGRLERKTVASMKLWPTAKAAVNLEAGRGHGEDESEDEKETPLMKFLKANRDLLRPSQQRNPPGNKDQHVAIKAEAMETSDPVTEAAGSGGAPLLISNLHLLAEIATRQSPSPPSGGTTVIKPEPDELVATTSLKEKAATRRPALPGLIPLAAVSMYAGRNGGAGEAAAICEQQSGTTAASNGLFSTEHCEAAGDGLLSYSGLELRPVVTRSRPMAGESGEGLLTGRNGDVSVYPDAGRTAAIFYPAATATATAGGQGAAAASAAPTATLFTLSGLQPIMSSSEVRSGAAREEGEGAPEPKYILPDVESHRQDSYRKTTPAEDAKGQQTNSCSSSASSSSSRESSPKSSDSPRSLDATASGGRVRCTHCGRICSTLAHLNNHIRSVHSTERPSCPKHLKCERCGKLFGRNSHLVEHVRTVHEGRKRVYQRAQCKDCGKEFARQCSLNQHLSTSHGKQFS
jgi:hypothetical protein